MQSTGVWSLNHDITTTSLGLSPTPIFLKSTPGPHRHNSVRVHPYAHPQHIRTEQLRKLGNVLFLPRPAVSGLTMVLAGSLSQLKRRNSLKASCWSKRRQKLVTRSHSHSNRLMATRSKYVHTLCSMGNSYAEYPPPHRLKYHKDTMRNQCVHMGT